MDIDLLLAARIEAECREKADAEYKVFNDRLAKSAYPSFGVRIPELRRLSKTLFRTYPYEEIRAYRPDTFEGVIVKGLTLGEITDFDRFTAAWDDFLPCFDSWAQTDTTTASLKIMKKCPDRILEYYLPLKDSSSEFTQRFFVLLTMDYFLDEAHIDRVLALWETLPSGRYYCDMAAAWGLATAAAKFYDKTLASLKTGAYSDFVVNAAIKKARESFRIAPERKAELLTLKR